VSSRGFNDAGEAADYVLDAPRRPPPSRLDEQLDKLRTHLSTRGHASETMSLIRTISERTYGIEFADDSPLSERVLYPAMSAEGAGMEDARFVRFVDDEGSVTFYASYTAYSGSHIGQQLLETEDFRSFTSTPMVGGAAANKGLALFPRRIRGRFAAMSRSDRESNSIAYSDHPFVWTDSVPCQRPARAWEALQLGNCGPPIETEAGWLVLTHGVGPMRSYHIGAILLALEDPTRIWPAREPPLSPAADEQDATCPCRLPCGVFVHAETLVLPYGNRSAMVSPPAAARTLAALGS
jgi:predicted GH43/DUF377 family glycosyl hydrolase